MFAEQTYLVVSHQKQSFWTVRRHRGSINTLLEHQVSGSYRVGFLEEIHLYSTRECSLSWFLDSTVVLLIPSARFCPRAAFLAISEDTHPNPCLSKCV